MHPCQLRALGKGPCPAQRRWLLHGKNAGTRSETLLGSKALCEPSALRYGYMGPLFGGRMRGLT
jgi:hypothetical protein